LPDALLYKVDRMSMAHAVEVRPPFLDDRIVAFAARLPERFKFSGSDTKLVLRHLMRNSLPPDVLRRPKIGFDIPIHEWFRGVLRPLLLETLNERAIHTSGLFEWTEVRRFINEHLDRKANWGYHLWGLVTLMLWMKRWNIEAPARVPLTITAASHAAGKTQLWEPAPNPPRTSEMPLD
jgi:asparagine synthase (glutamine-hydrolysing)